MSRTSGSPFLQHCLAYGLPLLAQGAYARLDGRLTFDNPDHHWGIDVIAKNLTDRAINSALGGLYLASKEEPRNVAIQFRYKW